MELELILLVECVQLAVGPDHQQTAGHIMVTRTPGDLLKEPHPGVAILLPDVGTHQVILASPDTVQPGDKQPSELTRESLSDPSYLGVDLSLV